MQTIFKLLAVATLSQIASSSRPDIYKRDNPLEVTLAELEGGLVKATVTNVGAEDLNLFAYGTLFDSAPVEKLSVYSSDAKAEFTGILRSVVRTGLTEDAFVSLAVGASYETTITPAAVHDLTAGGEFTFVAEGAIPYALADSTELSGLAIPFKSNVLTVHVDGAAAALVPRAVSALDKRSVIQSDCTGSRGTATRTAFSNCRTLALAAASAARSGSATKFSEYFKTTATATRTTVANRLTAVANECGSTTSGATRQYCTDVYGYCSSNVLAYTLPAQNVVVNCNLYFSALPALTSTCHAQDQATTTLHEFTHAPGVYSPGTVDNGYGYAAATSLSASRALANADSYALYANGTLMDS
ncbi:metallo protein-like proteinase [Bisporella sp. PMI_857]|nr:metallo protein-like proteinase [Bisporella sp. PMI_857]